MDLCIALSIRLSIRPLIHPLPYKGRSTFATQRRENENIGTTKYSQHGQSSEYEQGSCYILYHRAHNKAEDCWTWRVLRRRRNHCTDEFAAMGDVYTTPCWGTPLTGISTK